MLSRIMQSIEWHLIFFLYMKQSITKDLFIYLTAEVTIHVCVVVLIIKLIIASN